jgi:predicted Rossmann-fold nucleotide-binding protein
MRVADEREVATVICGGGPGMMGYAHEGRSGTMKFRSYISSDKRETV